MRRWYAPVTPPPRKLLAVVKGVYDEVYDWCDRRVDCNRNWMDVVVRFAFHTDNFSFVFYVFAGIKAMGAQRSEMLKVSYVTCDAQVPERIHKLCVWRYILEIIRCGAKKRGAISDVNVFKYISRDRKIRCEDRREYGNNREKDREVVVEEECRMVGDVTDEDGVVMDFIMIGLRCVWKWYDGTESRPVIP